MMRKNNMKANRTVSTGGVFKDKQLVSEIQERIIAVLSRKGGDNNKWIGSMTELDRALRNVIRTKTPSNWPSSPSVMRKVLNNAVYSLRRSGVSIKFSRTTDHMRKRVVEFVQR